YQTSHSGLEVVNAEMWKKIAVDPLTRLTGRPFLWRAETGLVEHLAGWKTFRQRSMSTPPCTTVPAANCMARPLTESFPASEMLNKTSFGPPKERPARKSGKGIYSNFFPHLSIDNLQPGV